MGSGSPTKAVVLDHFIYTEWRSLSKGQEKVQICCTVLYAFDTYGILCVKFKFS